MKSNRLSAWLAFALMLGATPDAPAHDAGAEMATAARRFLASLSEAQRAKTTFSFADEERRNWAFVPKDRAGLPVKEMTTEQRRLGMELLRSAMSDHGFRKATNIISLELILKDLEGPGRGVGTSDLKRRFEFPG